MLSFQLITNSAAPAFKLAWQLYVEAFPPEERRSLEQMQALLSHAAYRFMAIFSESEFQGFLGFWLLPKFTFLEHFAILPVARSKGVGKSALQAWIKAMRQPIVLEVEPPETLLAQRRIQFYQRSGFALNSLPYQQPPYDPQKPWVPLQVISYPAALSQQEFDEVVQVLYEEVYKVRE